MKFISRTVTLRCSRCLASEFRLLSSTHGASRSASTSSTPRRRTPRGEWCQRSTSCFWKLRGPDVDAMRGPINPLIIVDAMRRPTAWAEESVSTGRSVPPSASDKLQWTKCNYYHPISLCSSEAEGKDDTDWANMTSGVLHSKLLPVKWNRVANRRMRESKRYTWLFSPCYTVKLTIKTNNRMQCAPKSNSPSGCA